MDVATAVANLSISDTSTDALEPKKVFDKFCAENRLKPQFEYGADKKPNQKKTQCKLRILNYEFVGVGKSKSKKSARKKAIKRFLLFLISQNKIPALPKKSKNNNEKSKKCFVSESSNKESKCLNMTPPVVNGNWTIEVAQKRLKQFIKSNNKNEYKITCKCNENIYEVDMTLFVERLNKTISAFETGISERDATEKCSLSVISQLCGLGQIEQCLSSQKKKEKFNLDHNVVVSVDSKLMNNIFTLLKDLRIKPMDIKDTGNSNERKSLIVNKVPKSLRELNTFSGGKVISWCPPKSNWNTWLNKKISNPKNLTQISNAMSNDISKRKKDSLLQRKIKERIKLPIFNKKNEILEIVENNSVVIIQGGTGCGKTTQVCQFILDEYIDMKKGAYCNIICTQPRKVSAISIADRVAFERAEPLGRSVGYNVRFNSINPRSFGAILFCTVEILIRKLKNGLVGISHVIVDEIHERRADCEFLLIILKEIVQEYPELKVILMSANGNLNTFSNYFNNCPIINIEGRCYQVKEYYLEDIVQLLNYKPDKKKLKKPKNSEEVNCNLLVPATYPDEVRERVARINEDDQQLQIIESLLSFIENNEKMDGAVLIFLPGWAWIIELNNFLMNSKLVSEKCIILLLHSQLSLVEQHKVFKPVPPGMRKVILSTNIAETSITIDDVVFVIDYGKMNQVEYSNNITKFNIVWASKINVEQRKGRAGRVRAGICFNLYTKERFNKMDDNISSQLTHCPLHKIGLTIKLLKLGGILTFLKKAIDKPPVTAVKDALNLLREIKCIDANEKLTDLGQILAQLPVEPQFGRMMILGNIFLLGDALCTIAAGSSTNYDLFYGDGENTIKHTFSGNRCSDQLVFLNAFAQWDSYKLSNKYNLSTSVIKTSCNIKDQIKRMFIRFGFPECCFKVHNFDFGQTGIFDEPQLDMIAGLLTMAFYPNIYLHLEKRKVNLRTKGYAAVGKSSINILKTGSDRFKSPFFVFEEQVGVMCLKSTMVSPLHLLLFGAREIDYIDSSTILLDNWIHLKMDVKDAAAIVALRPVINDLILRTTKNPSIILKQSSDDRKLITVVRDLCNFNGGRHNLPPITFDS